MIDEEIDYTYALDLLKRINQIKIDGRDIQNYFQYRGYNFWQAYQTEIFIKAKRFSASPQKTISELTNDVRSPLVFMIISFLVTCCGVTWASCRKIKTIVYSVDKKPQGTYQCDFRLQELYEVLHKNGTPFVEFLHTVSATSLLKNIFKTRRFSLYVNGFDIVIWMKGLLDFKVRPNMHRDILLERELFSDSEIVFVQKIYDLLNYKFRYSQERVEWTLRCITFLQIQQMYLIDDAWHYFELVCASDIAKVKSVAIQHGHFTKYHVGVIPFCEDVDGIIIHPQKIFVWTEYWKKELLRIGSYYRPDTIVVAGMKARSEANQTYIKNSVPTSLDADTIRVLIPYETDVPKTKIKEYIQELICHNDITIFFKPRSDLDVDMQLFQYGFTRFEKNIQICKNIDDCQRFVDVAFGTYTTLLYDLINLNIPLVLATSIMDYGEGIIINGLGESSKSPQDIYSVIQNAASTPKVVLEKRKSTVANFSGALLTETLATDLNNEMI